MEIQLVRTTALRFCTQNPVVSSEDPNLLFSLPRSNGDQILSISAERIPQTATEEKTDPLQVLLRRLESTSQALSSSI
ncbi:hypothetical protein AAC387_Pa01g2403 [Persea americana]